MAGKGKAEPDARRMHQTTLRFAPDLWDAVSYEAELTGVSVAQYVREAVLTRIVYAAGRRGEPMLDSAMRILGVEIDPGTHPHESVEQAHRAAADSERQVEGTAALWAQSRQARARARELRDSVNKAGAARRRESEKS